MEVPIADNMMVMETINVHPDKFHGNILTSDSLGSGNAHLTFEADKRICEQEEQRQLTRQNGVIFR